MTDTSHRSAMTTASQYREEPSGWTNWVVFGGVMLIMLGAFQIIEGLVALELDRLQPLVSWLVDRPVTCRDGRGGRDDADPAHSLARWMHVVAVASGLLA